MIGYASVTPVRITYPKPELKPLPRLDALRDLISEGKTPAEAMSILERKDKHRGKIPESKPTGAGKPAPVTQYDRERVLVAIRMGYVCARNISDGIGMGRKRVGETLLDLCASGAINVSKVRASSGPRSVKTVYEVAA